MKWKLAVPFAFALVLPAIPAAHAAPWLCTNAYGIREFSYDPQSEGMKNCVDHPIAAHHNVVRETPREKYADSFPKVDSSTQKDRDTARRAILERELADEKKALAEAMQQLAEQKELRAKAKSAARNEDTLRPYQDRVRVHLGNISNLQKELGRDS